MSTPDNLQLTPRTDAVEKRQSYWARRSGGQRYQVDEYVVFSSFARELEREINRLNAENAKIKQGHNAQ